MKKIIIIGSGGLAADITTCFGNTVSGLSQLEIKGYIDYSYNIDKYWSRYHFEKPVLGDIDNYRIEEDDYFVIGVADIKFRKIVIDKIYGKGGRFINLIHPTSLVDISSNIGNGNIIFPYSYVGRNVQMGNFNLMNLQSIIGHDCIVGNNNVFATAVLCGHVKIGDDNAFGIRSTVTPKICIGSRNIIQAGLVVDKNVSDGSVLFCRLKKKGFII
jgi:sugar O-acyltransferase (sialic acid O-acetyltransferase NeuD family)